MAKSKLSPTPGHDETGLHGSMPRCPGDAKAGLPPSRREVGGDLPPWLDSSKAKWTKGRIAAQFGQQRPSKVGAPDVSDLPDAMGSIIPPVPAHALPSPVKDPKGGF